MSGAEENRDNSGGREGRQDVKRRVLCMKRGKGSSEGGGSVRMNPYYRADRPMSVLSEPETDGSNKMLRQAIQKGDVSYISEFLLHRNKGNMVRRLGSSDREALGELLLELVDQPLKSEAVEMMREIVSNIRDVEPFISRLRERAMDFSKLIYIKGKIDYLRFTTDAAPEEDAETVVKG